MKIMRTFFFLILVLVLATAAFGAVWYFGGLRPVDSRAQTARVFNVPAGANAASTGQSLQNAGLIRNGRVFLVYVWTHGLRTQLKAGNYSLSPSKSTAETAAILTHGDVLRDTVVIPEGSSLEQITAAVSKKGVTEADFKAALDANYTNDFLLERPTDAGLEGYLFPDSYSVTGTTTARALVSQMLDNFGEQITPELFAGFKAQGLGLHEAVTLASIIEKEVANPTDRPIVAQVFLSRLKASQALQSDVTVIYAAKLLGKPFDTRLDSPYNTYVYKGLPPGPIDSPGLSALQAVAKPSTTTSYLFFWASKDGKTYFAKDFAAHQSNITNHP